MITQCQRCEDTTAESSTPYATLPVGPFASQSAIHSDAWSLGLNIQTSQFAVIIWSTEIGSHISESYYCSYEVATSCVNRCVSWTVIFDFPARKYNKPFCI
jgi:hypothetical protein